MWIGRGNGQEGEVWIGRDNRQEGEVDRKGQCGQEGAVGKKGPLGQEGAVWAGRVRKGLKMSKKTNDLLCFYVAIRRSSGLL